MTFLLTYTRHKWADRSDTGRTCHRRFRADSCRVLRLRFYEWAATQHFATGRHIPMRLVSVRHADGSPCDEY